MTHEAISGVRAGGPLVSHLLDGDAVAGSLSRPSRPAVVAAVGRENLTSQYVWPCIQFFQRIVPAACQNLPEFGARRRVGAGLAVSKRPFLRAVRAGTPAPDQRKTRGQPEDSC